MHHQTSPSFIMGAIISASCLFTITFVTGLQAMSGWDVGARGARFGRLNDSWHLRPSDLGDAPIGEPAAARPGLAAAVPDERRFVRVVYPGLTGAR